ncbi:hypothetical protein [Aureimonas sp. ME7]|uniref:hypothetical protein n=1 Tax=Aureimonas sp. ME7 TaxID=2744252 RepID=UPI0015F4677F|nr:hypothetical protein [Aureimonas sp. ME7]
MSRSNETERDEASKTGEDRTPGAGPHAKPELTNEDATPGAGSLPDEKDAGDDAGAG